MIMQKITYKNPTDKSIFIGDVLFKANEEKVYNHTVYAFEQAVQNGTLEIEREITIEKKPVTFKVLFERNEHGTLTQVMQEIEKDKTVTPEVLEEEDWEFKGWFTDKRLTKEFDASTPVTKNFTVYAKWEEK